MARCVCPLMHTTGHQVRFASWRNLMGVGLLVLVTGCTSTGAFRHTDHPAIQSVSLHNDIDKPEHLLYVGAVSRSMRGGPVFSPLGTLAAALATAGEGTDAEIGVKLEEAMSQASIDIRELVREQFLHQLRQLRVFQDIRPAGGDAEFLLTILQYGFQRSRDGIKPWLQVQGRLQQSGGPVLWTNAVEIQSVDYEPTPEYPLQECLENPARIKAALTVAAQLAAERLVKNIR